MIFYTIVVDKAILQAGLMGLTVVLESCPAGSPLCLIYHNYLPLQVIKALLSSLTQNAS
jgi:hypothetical protein